MSSCLRLLGCTALLALSGCSLLSKPSAAPIVYAPRPSWSAPTPAAGPVSFQLLVDIPQASAALDSNRIAVMPTAGVLQIYKGAQWPDRVPPLLRALLMEAFDRSGRIAGVGDFATGLRADYTLATQIQDFQAEYRDGSPVAVLRISAKLVDALSGQIVAARVFDATARSDATATGAVVQAFETALSQMLPEIVDWTLTEGSRARAAAAPAAGQAPSPPGDISRTE